MRVAVLAALVALVAVPRAAQAYEYELRSGDSDGVLWSRTGAVQPWGAVCVDAVAGASAERRRNRNKAASVACRSLGYDRGLGASCVSMTGPGYDYDGAIRCPALGTIFTLEGLLCSGAESALADCPRNPATTCSRSEALVVRCGNGPHPAYISLIVIDVVFVALVGTVVVYLLCCYVAPEAAALVAYPPTPDANGHVPPPPSVDDVRSCCTLRDSTALCVHLVCGGVIAAMVITGVVVLVVGSNCGAEHCHIPYTIAGVVLLCVAGPLFAGVVFRACAFWLCDSDPANPPAVRRPYLCCYVRRLYLHLFAFGGGITSLVLGINLLIASTVADVDFAALFVPGMLLCCGGALVIVVVGTMACFQRCCRDEQHYYRIDDPSPLAGVAPNKPSAVGSPLPHQEGPPRAAE